MADPDDEDDDDDDDDDDDPAWKDLEIHQEGFAAYVTGRQKGGRVGRTSIEPGCTDEDQAGAWANTTRREATKSPSAR